MLPTVLVIYALMSVVTFITYGWDKRAAGRPRRRIPENTLHLLELLGGVPGVLVGQQVFRHKRRKGAFMAVTITIAVLHLAAWALVIYRRG